MLVNGFMARWPLRLTFRDLRELPVKVGNMAGMVSAFARMAGLLAPGLGPRDLGRTY